MTIQEINKAYHRIIGSLDNKELKEAFVSLHGMISGLQAYEFQEKRIELQNTYVYMLKYRLEGIKDPMQEQIYKSLFISVYELADKVKHKGLKEQSPLAFYSKRRSLEKLPQKDLKELHAELSVPLLSKEAKVLHETALTTLFQLIWTSDLLTANESLAIKEILYDNELPYAVGCQIVSALWVGLQMSFDKEKLSLLFDALHLQEDEVRIRALICILLTLYTYRKRTWLYPQITDRLDAFAELNPGFTKEIQTIILRFILSRETEKITRKLQEEIIPEMMKLGPQINKKINLKDFTLEQVGDEMNPEWQEMLSNSSLGKKMEELSELQQEGADLMHSTFVHLKSFPFFRDMSNWFLPFTINHSGLENEIIGGGVKEALEMLTSTPFMCNSDKYSLLFTVLNLPESQRNMMMGQFSGQISEMMEQNKQELQGKRGNAEFIISRYIQDMYRFYKLYPSHLEFDDIFSHALDFHNLSSLKPYITDEESLTVIAEYYLRKKYFQDALSVYEQLAGSNSDNDILYQKIGYCKQMMGNLKEALEAYLYADLLHSGSKWVIRRIAGCYRTLKQPEQALVYYRRYETLAPDDLSIQLNIGHCLLEQKEYSEALKYYFKVDYLDSNGSKAWRPIAWISFLTGRYDQARNYYRKILDNQPNMQDYLNAGHTEWALQNLKEALGYYKKSIESEFGDFYKFHEQFTQDIPDLLVAGVEESEIPLILDQLKYMLEGTL